MSIQPANELRMPSPLQLAPLSVPVAALAAGIVARRLDYWSGRLPEGWAIVAALGLGTLVSLSLIGWTVDVLWYAVGKSDAAQNDRSPVASNGAAAPLERRLGWLAKLLGIAELMIYFAALASGEYAFAGGWLAIKTTGKVVSDWNQYSVPHHGRQIFNIFLLGTALSAFNAAATFGMAAWLATGDPTRLR